jgi:hypothetical protein
MQLCMILLTYDLISTSPMRASLLILAVCVAILSVSFAASARPLQHKVGVAVLPHVQKLAMNRHIAANKLVDSFTNTDFLIIDEQTEVDASVNTPVPYTNCGQSSDLIVINSVTSSLWPPVLGQTSSLFLNFTSLEEVTSGTYTAEVSVDNFPIINKSGDISKYFQLPINKGNVIITKNITLPSSSPISGTIGVQLSADDQNQAELFCVQFGFSI